MTRFLSDWQLLEMAAIALGYSTIHELPRERHEKDSPVAALAILKDGELVSSVWNPLEDDAQGFRLMVDLKLDVRSLATKRIVAMKAKTVLTRIEPLGAYQYARAQR